MAGFQLDFAVDNFGHAEEEIGKAAKKLDLAAARALRKTAQWLRTHSSREIARELRITQSPIRHRFDIFSKATAREVKLWVGLRPLSVHYLGTPKQTATGVSVGHREYEDAFISPMKTKYPLVWRRKGRERLPLQKVTEDWADEGVTALERWEKRAEQKFVGFFEHEARHVFSSA